MKTRYNQFYGNCIHLEWRYQKSTYIGNSHSKVIGWCKLFKANVYDFKLKDDLPICCVSHSPYAVQNCEYFKDKNMQTSLSEFGDGQMDETKQMKQTTISKRGALNETLAETFIELDMLLIKFNMANSELNRHISDAKILIEKSKVIKTKQSQQYRKHVEIVLSEKDFVFNGNRLIYRKK